MTHFEDKTHKSLSALRETDITIPGLKLGIPVILYHLTAVGDQLTHQLSQVPEVKYIIVSTRRIPQIRDAQPCWVVKNNLWDKSLRFRSLCVIERAEDRQDSLEEVSEDSGSGPDEVTDEIVDVETVEAIDNDANKEGSESGEQDVESPKEADFRLTFENVFVALFTSGTTGLSKGTLVKANKFALMGHRFGHVLGVKSSDVLLTISPVARLIWQISVSLATGCSILPNNGVNDVPPSKQGFFVIDHESLKLLLVNKILIFQL